MTSRSRSHLRRIAVLGVAAAAAVLPACGADDDGEAADATTTTVEASAEVVVENVWARTSPMNAANGAVYMVIRGGDVDDALVAAAVDPTVAAEVQIHETAMTDPASGDMDGEMGSDTTMAPTMEMRQVDSVAVPAGGSVSLEPGGYHVMLMGLPEPLEVGSTFELTLTFETAGERTVTVEVRDSP